MKKTAAFNCPWDLSPSNIVRICATSLLRHLTKIGYSSRFARVLCTNSVKDARARTRSNSTIFVRIPSRVNWVKLVFPTRKPRHSNRHLINAKCQQMWEKKWIFLPLRCCRLKAWLHRDWKPNMLVRLAMLSYFWKPLYDPKKSNLIRLLCVLPWEDLWLPIQCLL